MSALITQMDARDLVGRLIINENGAEFVVTRLVFEAASGEVIIWIREIHSLAGETGIRNLSGWEIHQPLTDEEIRGD